MKKLDGGFENFYWLASVAGLRLTAEHLRLIRDDEMDPDWYGEAADACYQKAREKITETLKRQLVALAHRSPLLEPVVDRRPSRLALSKGEA